MLLLLTMRGMLSVWTKSFSSPADCSRLKKNVLVGWYETVPFGCHVKLTFSHFSLEEKKRAKQSNTVPPLFSKQSLWEMALDVITKKIPRFPTWPTNKARHPVCLVQLLPQASLAKSGYFLLGLVRVLCLTKFPLGLYPHNLVGT